MGNDRYQSGQPVCEHGSLARCCNVCELEAEVARLREQSAGWAEAFRNAEAENERLRKCCTQRGARWNDCSISKPEPMTEVLVWIDGKRGAAWKNNHALVAYMAPTGEWFEERHPSRNPLIGVIAWTPILDYGA